jgi:multimeric flavodoxin WrbA
MQNIKIIETASFLKEKGNILLLTTSNRYEKHIDQPKSTALAYRIASLIGKDTCKVIEVPKLKIYPCEGNVSAINGNNCGVKESKLLNTEKNPTGNIRCWAAYNNEDDELYKIANEIFKADVIIFFSSVRWGQANSFYQKLIERLNWIENRNTTLQEENIVEGKLAGFICLGQNWNAINVVKTQKEVLKFYGFETPNELFWFWQYTEDAYDETKQSYIKSIKTFQEKFNISMVKFSEKIKKIRQYFK